MHFGGMMDIMRMFSFTNNIPQRDGTHLAGLRGALTRTINSYFTQNLTSKKEKYPYPGMTPRRFYLCIISKSSDPKFSSQTKDKLVLQK